MLQITDPTDTPPRFALFQLGFRPFFLAASLFAVFGTLAWVALYNFQWVGLPAAYPPMLWHAHEMVFAYALAVIAGFLLTAVKNWTGLPTLHGYSLAGLFGLWIIARLLPFTGLPLAWTAVADLGFTCWLAWAASYPIIKAKQWAQAGIIAKVSLILLANVAFYLCLLGGWVQSSVLAIYGGLYIVLALILTMGRRVIPFFIERGVGVPFTARNSLWLDRASLILFLVFALADLIALGTGQRFFYYGVAALALIQVLLHTIRLQGWYHSLIWTKPLLWVLYLAYGWLIIGFALKFFSIVGGISPWLAVHAFAYGGIGMMTLGMMARVSLGHTGRNVMSPPIILPVLFALLLLGAVVRVFAVWVWPSLHQDWILVAQLLWITSFTGFIAIYLPMWIKPNIPQIR